MARWTHIAWLTLLSAGCASAGSTGAGVSPPSPVTAAPATSHSFERPQYPSTYQRRSFPDVLIRNATIMTAAGSELLGTSILLAGGRVTAIGTNLVAPSGAMIIDGTGKFITPGLIDTHSHLGVYAAPGTPAESDGNELTNPVTAEVWAEHSVWPQDPQIPLAVAGGVTVMHVLPGSGNLIGGRSVTLRLLPARTVQELKFPGAPHGVKMACGENPKRVYASRGPSTRMGNMAGYRAAFIAAEAYRQRWDTWLATRRGDPPARDLRNETLAGVLRGEILVQNHCYRADEMAFMLDLAREFGFTIRSFHHAIEAYKIGDLLAAHGTAASVWADWGGFKMEAFDEILENAGIVHAAGARTIIHTDSPDGIQRMNQDAAKAMFAAQRAGLSVSRNDALRWITANAAWALGIDEWTGTLEVGKMADVVLWSGDPFSIYSKAEKVFAEGYLVFDRLDPSRQFMTDFNLGQTAPGVGR